MAVGFYLGSESVSCIGLASDPAGPDVPMNFSQFHMFQALSNSGAGMSGSGVTLEKFFFRSSGGSLVERVM
jgi:hypothetical protein